MRPAVTGVRPVPTIDHVMVLLDQRAHQDVLAAGFLGERFGRLKVKEADSSVAGQYSTLGVAGDNTLVELFSSAMPGASALTGGLVFSFEIPGSSPEARALLDDHPDVSYHGDLVRRTVAGSDEQQPWYHLISVDLGAGSPLLLFLNEVTPEYFQSLGARPDPDGRQSRRAYLDAVLGAPADGSRLMRDITSVTVRVRPPRAQRIVDALTTLGFVEGSDPAGPELVGPDLTLRLRTDEHAVEGILEIQIQLAGDAIQPAEYLFGETSRLVIGPAGTAVWSFTPVG
jgi:Family of unknown function (DUF5829)